MFVIVSNYFKYSLFKCSMFYVEWLPLPLGWAAQCTAQCWCHFEFDPVCI